MECIILPSPIRIGPKLEPQVSCLPQTERLDSFLCSSLFLAILMEIDAWRIFLRWRSRNAKRPLLEEPLKEKKKLRSYNARDEVKEERKDDESEVQEEKKQEEEQRVYEYTSGEDDDYVWPDGKRRRTREEWARYYKQIKESEGFDVDPSPDTFEFGLTALTNFEDEGLIRCTKSAIEQFNKENATSYEFVKIEKTTCIVAAGYWYNITFQATDGGSSPKTFQAKVFYGIRHDIRVSFCRLKPVAG
ncbi:hypothetical protein ACMD2_17706 [Ananas comosus]|uniref:Cystatin domain-containing protein n=3 Tax=Ananas comosus TaxID=4615 RepID=A0A199UST2_ANACO|nr:hypothetical protein ACMD2_17706 [Ananas comosus]